MRIISGKARGTKLFSPDGSDTRPTLDRVREAIFSMINFHLPEAHVLDLFAGSGAMGLEAVSRGAAKAVFVDNDRNAVETVKKNIEKTHAECCSVEKTDFEVFLKTTGCRFNIIFLDPPYDSGCYDRALSLIGERGILAGEGIVVAECRSDYELDCNGYEVLRMRRYGKVNVYVLKKADTI